MGQGENIREWHGGFIYGDIVILHVDFVGSYTNLYSRWNCIEHCAHTYMNTCQEMMKTE